MRPFLASTSSTAAGSANQPEMQGSATTPSYGASCPVDLDDLENDPAFDPTNLPDIVLPSSFQDSQPPVQVPSGVPIDWDDLQRHPAFDPTYLPDHFLSETLDAQPEPTRTCECPKTGCVKRYCPCFARRRMCTGSCRCVGCKNKPDTSDVVREARAKLLAKDPNAFNIPLLRARGCECRKGCVNNNCQCRKIGNACSDKCRCSKHRRCTNRGGSFTLVRQGCVPIAPRGTR